MVALDAEHPQPAKESHEIKLSTPASSSATILRKGCIIFTGIVNV